MKHRYAKPNDFPPLFDIVVLTLRRILPPESIHEDTYLNILATLSVFKKIYLPKERVGLSKSAFTIRIKYMTRAKLFSLMLHLIPSDIKLVNRGSIECIPVSVLKDVRAS